jgi:hypothetical protein
MTGLGFNQLLQGPHGMETAVISFFLILIMVLVLTWKKKK